MDSSNGILLLYYNYVDIVNKLLLLVLLIARTFCLIIGYPLKILNDQ